MTHVESAAGPWEILQICRVAMDTEVAEARISQLGFVRNAAEGRPDVRAQLVAILNQLEGIIDTVERLKQSLARPSAPGNPDTSE